LFTQRSSDHRFLAPLAGSRGLVKARLGASARRSIVEDMSARSQRWVEASLARSRAHLSSSVEPCWVELRGASMEPTLRDGDRLRVEPLGATDPAAGEIVALRLGGRVVVHRVVRAEGGSLRTRGDGNRVADGVVARADVLGRVVQVRRGRHLFPTPRRGGILRRVAHWVRCHVG